MSTNPGTTAARRNSRDINLLLARLSTTGTLRKWSHAGVMPLAVAALIGAFAAGVRAQAINGQKQTPNAAAVYSAGTGYNWVPNTDQDPITASQWSASNVGTPVISAAPSDTRRGADLINDPNSESVLAGGDMFTVCIDMPGDVKQPIQMHCSDAAGTAEYVQNYQGVTLWRLNTTTGAVEAGPYRLDSHVGICSLPHIVVSASGNLFIGWKESVAGSGDRISAVYFTVATNTFSAAAAVTPYYAAGVSEWALASGPGGAHDDAAFVFRTGVGPAASQIYVQHILNNLNPQWNAATPIRVDATTSTKWCPLIRWNTILDVFDVAWGDGVFAPSSPADLMVQTYTTAGATFYAAGGVPVGGVNLNTDHCEFYMEPCIGYIDGTPPADQGATNFFYRNSAGGVEIVSTILGGSWWPSPGVRAFYNASDSVGYFDSTAYPCSFTKYSTGGREDVVGVYYNKAFGTNGHIEACYYNNATAGGVYTSSGYGTNSQQFRSFAGINNNGMFVAVPDNPGDNADNGYGTADVYAISLSPLAFRWASPIQQLVVRNTQTEDDWDYNNDERGEPYYSGVITSGANAAFCLYYFQYGYYGLLPAQYTWSEDYTNLPNPETNETYRNGMEASSYDFASFSTQASWPFINDPTLKGIQDQTWDIDPNTALLGHVGATVYSEITATTGYSSIILGLQGGNHWTILQGNATNGSYYQPKVGIYYDAGSGHDMALVTYIHELYAGASQFEDVTVDLTNGTVTADPLGAIAGPDNNERYRNWAIVADNTATPTNFVCVYGGDYATPGTNDGGTVRVVGYGGGGRIWGPNTIGPYVAGNSVDQVRACYNPDVANSGAYVIWRETPSATQDGGLNAGFGVEIVNSGAGPSIWCGLTAYGQPNHRGNSCITAGANPPPNPGAPYWAFMAWEDEGDGGTPQPSMIFGDVLTNTGAYWAPGASNIGGVDISPIAPYESHHPDAIANPDNPTWPMVAYDIDQTSTNGRKQIEIQNLNLTLTTPFNGIVDIQSPDPTPTLPSDGTCSWEMDDGKWSQLGFMQRRPKLIAIDADSSAYPYDRSGTYANLNHWVMCVFETEAYNLYDAGAMGTGGTAPDYGLAGTYLDLWNAEYNRRAGPNSGYLQNNIVARVLNPSLAAGASPTEPILGGELAVFTNTNAQDLVSLAYTKELGPVATSLDYVNTAQTNAVACMDRIIPDYYFTPGIIGGPLNGTWAAPVPPAVTANMVPQQLFLNRSWFPLVLHPAVGSPDCFGPPANANTWLVDAVSAPTITINPEQPETPTITVDYYGNWNNATPPVSIENTLTVTAHAEWAPTLWPLSLPDYWGNSGNIGAGQGVGFKQAAPVVIAETGGLTITLAANPATSSEIATLAGIPGRTANLAAYNVLGEVMQKSDAVSINTNGAKVPLDVSTWPSGNYLIVAVGDEGSRTSVMLSVNH